MNSGMVIWAGWIGGIAIGLYSLLQLWISNKQLGCSLAYGNFCGMGSRLSYFHIGEFKQLNNWRIWFILGIPLGGFIALITSPDPMSDTLLGIPLYGQISNFISPVPSFEWSMDMGTKYNQILPQSDWLKAIVVTIGGILMGLGARLAGGCTSGHVIAGCSLLNPASFIAAALFFIGGLVTVQLLSLGLG